MRGGGVKRWMIVAALGLAAAGGVLTPAAAQASSSSSSSKWYQVYQANASGSFFQTSAINKSNIWSVGEVDTKAGKTIYQPFIRHFNGRAWQAVTIPHSSGSTSTWVTASAANNVWVGGLKNTSIANTVAYRWNGARWAKIPLPAMTDLQGVVALAPNNVWAYGGSGTVPYDVFHWTGSRWHYYLPTSIDFVPQDISASGSNNVWVSGFAYSGSKQVVAAYRWNGTGWHRSGVPHPSFNNAGANVTAVSRSNVWIGWADNNTAHALHWDGHRWRGLTVPFYANPLNIVPDGKGGYWFGAQATLTGSKWTEKLVPGFAGSFGGVTRIPGTTSSLLNSGVEATGSSTEMPTIFRFNL